MKRFVELKNTYCFITSEMLSLYFVRAKHYNEWTKLYCVFQREILIYFQRKNFINRPPIYLSPSFFVILLSHQELKLVGSKQSDKITDKFYLLLVFFSDSRPKQFYRQSKCAFSPNINSLV